MWRERISIDPAILVGKPVIKGTRLAVEFLLELMAEGWSAEQILDNYPPLAAEDLRAVLHYASETLKREPRLEPVRIGHGVSLISSREGAVVFEKGGRCNH